MILCHRILEWRSTLYYWDIYCPYSLWFKRNLQNLCRSTFGTSESSLPKIVWKLCAHNFCTIFAQKKGLTHNFCTIFLSPLGLRLGASRAQFLHNFLTQVQFFKNLRLYRTEMSQLYSETGGILFREYCLGGENSLSLTDFWGKLGEFWEKLGEFALAHKYSLNSLPGTRWWQQKLTELGVWNHTLRNRIRPVSNLPVLHTTKTWSLIALSLSCSIVTFCAPQSRCIGIVPLMIAARAARALVHCLDGPNRQSLVFSERGQLSQAIPQFHLERILHQWTPITRFESQRNECRACEDQILSFGGDELQRTLAIRIAAITLGSDFAVTIARFRPSNVHCYALAT